MTVTQKQQILALRANGEKYSVIAAELGLSENTVKTFCWRNKKAENAENKDFKIADEVRTQCENCDKPLERLHKRKPRRFCGDACRLAWWGKNRDSLNRKAVYPLVCAHCNSGFDSYGNKSRKYCRHECYIAARFGGREAVVTE